MPSEIEEWFGARVRLILGRKASSSVRGEETPMVALSTAWGARRTKNARQLIDEARRLGFASLEIGHSLNLATVMELLEASEREEVSVVSLHNFCPGVQWLPRSKSGPDIYSPSSLDRGERSMAVKKTKGAIDMAERFGAKAVVMHLGRVAMKSLTPALIELYEAGEKGTARYEKIKGKLLDKREKKRFRHLNELYKSLDELLKYSEPKGIKIGIENRYSLEEIPAFDEVGLILDKFEGANIYYWHDVGHAVCCEELDVMPQESFLRTYSDRMVGIHLHDVIGVSDHKVPLRGEFDFTTLRPYVSKETIKVVEAFVPAPDEDVVRGMEYIRKCFTHEGEAARRTG
jgi:sugar phosphate isomerase/epimerase